LVKITNTREETTMRNTFITLGSAAAALIIAVGTAFAHGDVTPQPVDTKGLKALGTEWVKENPYRGDAKAIQIGTSAYAQNCARCHGIDAVSGGIAPDLRYLPEGLEGDEWFQTRFRGGSVRDGRVYMPPFEGVLSQEAAWAIRAYLDSVHEN
jgi:cytochrome c-550 PedF